MIPNTVFADPPVVSDFLPPNDEQYYNFKQTVLGGLDLENTTQGRESRRWVIYYQNATIKVKPENDVVKFSMPVSNVKTVSLAFDSDMRMVIAWVTPTGANLYYYDKTSSAYVTKTFTGVTSCRVSADNAKAYYLPYTDVIFAYTLNNKLYYRQQRDNYDIEYFIGNCNYTLIKLGQTTTNRLQFQLVSDTDMLGVSRIEDTPLLLGGPAPVVFLYSIVPDTFNINEGQTITFTVNTSYTPDGTVIKYANSGGTVSENDFVMVPTGSVVINNNTASFSLTLKSDLSTEDYETLVMSIYNDKNQWLAQSNVIIVNDTSVSLNAKFPVKLVTNGYSLIQPLIDKFPIKIASNIYSLIQPNIDKFPVALKTLAITLIQPNIDRFPVQLRTKHNTLIDFAVHSFPVKLSVISYTVVPDVTSINEGGTVTFTVTTTGVDDGTRLDYYIDSGAASISDFSYDPNDANVSLYLTGDNINSSTVPVDVSIIPKTLTVLGNTYVSTVTKKDGLGSICFDGVGDYIKVNDTVPFGTSDFTVELWFKLTAYSTGIFFCARHAAVSDSSTICMYLHTDASGGIYSSNYLGSVGPTFELNKWYHIAMCRKNTTMYYFVNGVKKSTYENVTNNFTSTSFTVGANADGSEPLNGYIDSLKVTKNIALYTTDFNTYNMSSQITIMNQTASFSLKATEDLLTEGEETFTLRIQNTAISPRFTITPVITINDTSRSRVYSLTPNTNSIAEGGTIVYTVSTENVADGTILKWRQTNGTATQSDFSTPLSGTITVSGPSQTFSLVSIDSGINNVNKTIILSLNSETGNMPLAVSSSVTIVDDQPKYTMTASVTDLGEGSVVTYTVNTSNVPNGTVVYWYSDVDLTPSYGTATGADFGYAADWSNVGTAITVNNNVTGFTLTSVKDALVENIETLAITLRSSLAGPLLVRAPLVYINDATVATTLPPAKAYTVTVSPSSVNEGDSLYITVTSNDTSGSGFSLVPVGTNITSYDFTYGSTENQPFYLSGGSYVNTQIWVKSDFLTEGSESFTMKLYKFKAGNTGYLPADLLATSNVVTINDTAVAPTNAPPVTSAPGQTYAVSTSNTSVREGDKIYYNVTTTNVPNGTRIMFQTLNNTPGLELNDVGWGSSTMTDYGNNFTINNNSGSFWVTALVDNVIEPDQGFNVTLHDYAGWVARGRISGDAGRSLAMSNWVTILANSA